MYAASPSGQSPTSWPGGDATYTMPAAGTRLEPAARRAPQNTWTLHEEAARLRRLRSLLGLFSLYALALLTVVIVSEGADIGCILAGIAGHVLYATHRVVDSWRDAASLEGAKSALRLNAWVARH